MTPREIAALEAQWNPDTQEKLAARKSVGSRGGSGPAKHLLFGGSTAHRWLRCAGSVKLCASLPPQPESEHMARGTAAHALLEHALRGAHENVLDAAGEPTDVPGWARYDLEDVEAVQVAVDHVIGIMGANADAIIWIEKQVILSDDVGGTSDVVIYIPSKRHLHVIDYKHGAGKYVEAEGNPQLKLYAAAAIFSMPELDVGTIYSTVIQPRCWQGEPIRTAVYGVADMIAYSDDVDAAVVAARAPDPVFTPGDEQCAWCPAAHICPAHRDDAFGALTVPASTLPVGDEIVIKLPVPGDCRDPAILAKLLAAAPKMKAFIAAIEDIGYVEAMGGKHIPGQKLVAKRATRKWADEQTASAYFEPLAMHRDAVYKRELLSPSQIEKLLKGRATKDEIAQFVVKESSGLKLVAETEPGEAVNPLELLASASAPPVNI